MNDDSHNFFPELKCPVCLEYMLPPITMCTEGHNICNSCKSQVKRCPICSENFTSLRNISLETIASRMQVPCKSMSKGREKRLPLCLHGPYKCPFAITSPPCSWEGPFTCIKDHIRSQHVEHGDVRDVLGIHNVRLPNFETSSAWCQAMVTMEEVFFRMSKIIDGFLYCCVLYVGPKVNASKYNYRMTIYSSDGKGHISACHETLGYESDLNEIYENGNCAVFHCKFAKRCMNEEDELIVEEEIITAPH